MKNSFSTSNFYFNQQPEKMLNWALENNFEGMEIWADVPGFYVDGVRDETLKLYSKKASDLSLSIHTPIYGVSIGSVNPGILSESMRQIQKILSWADIMPFDILVIHAGMTPSLSEEVNSKVRDIIYNSIQKLIDVAEKKGVRIVIENTGISERYWDREVKRLTDLIDEFKIGLCLDIGHLNLTKNPKEEFSKLKKYIEHIHISDNDGKKDDHFPVGEGSIDYSPYMEIFKDFKGMAVHEIHCPEDPAGATLRSRANLIELIDKNVSRETSKR